MRVKKLIGVVSAESSKAGHVNMKISSHADLEQKFNLPFHGLLEFTAKSRVTPLIQEEQERAPEGPRIRGGCEVPFLSCSTRDRVGSAGLCVKRNQSR